MDAVQFTQNALLYIWHPHTVNAHASCRDADRPGASGACAADLRTREGVRFLAVIHVDEWILDPVLLKSLPTRPSGAGRRFDALVDLAQKDQSLAMEITAWSGQSKTHLERRRPLCELTSAHKPPMALSK